LSNTLSTQLSSAKGAFVLVQKRTMLYTDISLQVLDVSTIRELVKGVT
jgi:hypothetical protein